MKKILAIFFALIVLALCAFMAGNLYLSARAGDYAISGELISGDAAAAEGLVFTERAEAMTGHLRWESEYDAANFSSSTEAGWSFERRDQSPDGEPAFSLSGFGVTVVGYGVGDSFIGGNEVQKAIFDELHAGIGESGSAGGDFLLNDYAGYWPAEVYVSNVVGMSSPVADILRVPFEREQWVHARLTVEPNDGWEFEISPVTEPVAGWADVRSVCAGGWLYYICAAYHDDGSLMNAGLMPGGSWGLYRMRCMEARGGWELDWDSAELVLPVDGFKSIWLEAMDDARLLLVSVEDGAVFAHTLNAESGELIQRLEIFPETGEYGGASDVYCFTAEGGVVFEFNGAAAAYLDDGETLTPALYVPDTLADTRPGFVQPEQYVYCELADCALINGRFAALYEANIQGNDEPGQPYYGYILTVSDETGVLCAEWLETPFSEMVSRYTTSYYTSCELGEAIT